VNKKPNRRRTPLLFVLLGAAIFAAAASYVSSHLAITNEVLEPVVTTVLVAAGAFLR
jgi:hypothetical protein